MRANGSALEAQPQACRHNTAGYQYQGFALGLRPHRGGREEEGGQQQQQQQQPTCFWLHCKTAPPRWADFNSSD